MNSVLDEIKSIPGIMGGFIIESTLGIVASNLPTIFKKQNLDKIGMVIEKMYVNSRSSFTDISEISLYYEESTLIARPVGTTGFLVIICDPSVNNNLLTMILNMVTDKLEKIGTEFDHANKNNSKKEETFNPPNEFNPPNKTVSVEKIMNEGPLSEQLQGMQKALFKIIGPMAKIIFKDAVSSWIKSHDPSNSSIPYLLEILKNEINDVEKEETYLKMIKSYVKP